MQATVARKKQSRQFGKDSIAKPPVAKAMQARLITLFNSGAHTELQQQLLRLIEQFPDFGFAWKLLGASLQLQGKNAMESLQASVRLLPLDAEAHCNLGVAFKQAGELDQAIASYQRAVGINPRYADAYCCLANAQRERGLLDEAIASCGQALAHAPKFSEAHAILGTALKALGQFDLSLSSLRNALLLTHQKNRSLAMVPRAEPRVRDLPKAPMLSPEARAALKVIKERLDAAGIPWCLFAGTLLGVVRDGDLLPYDKDVDIALPFDVDRKRLTQLLAADGEFRLAARHNRGSHEAHHYDMAFVHTRHHINVDLFFLHPDGPDHFLAGPDHPGQPILCRIHRFDIGMRVWRGELWPVPVQHERYFCDIYGDDWQQPDPYFDTVISNPSRIAEAIPVVLCYGYTKLISHLRDCNWHATKAYCAQLQKRVADPLLDEVGHWAEQQLALAETVC